MTWKSEGPYERQPASDPLDDVGPAWIDPAEEQSAPTPVWGGRWITRREAREFARKNGYALFEDSGSATPEPATRDSSTRSIGAANINERLRALGVGPDELTVEHGRGDNLLLTGSRVEELDSVVRTRNPKAAFNFRTAGVGMHTEEALNALDQLAPGWRGDSPPTA